VTGSISIYKWARSGPRLKVSANPHMVSKIGERFLLISVRNRGGQRTTIQAIGLVYFGSSWKQIATRARWLSRFGINSSERAIAIIFDTSSNLPAVVDGDGVSFWGFPTQ
jgi:hypothetical protein